MTKEAKLTEDVLRVIKPWGYELIFVKTDRYVGKIIHVNAGEKLSLQYHRVKDETMRLAKGKVEIQLDGKTLILSPGDTVRIRPGTKHSVLAIEDTDIFEVSTPETDDVVRLEDRYGREGTTEP